MLESASEKCVEAATFIEGCQGFLTEAHAMLHSLRNFGDNVKTLSKNATRLTNFVVNFRNAFNFLAKLCFGPLSIIKTIQALSDPGLKFLAKTLDSGAKRIKTFASTVEGRMKSLVTKSMVNKVENLSITAEKPPMGLNELGSIIDMIISIASLGIVDIALISKLASSSTDLKKFFTTLSESMGSVKDAVENVCSQTSAMREHFSSVQNFSNNITSKFAMLAIPEGFMTTIQPYLDKARYYWDKFASSWLGRRIINTVFRPIEWVMNNLASPFKSAINHVVSRLNPMAPVNNLLSSFANPLRMLPSESFFTSRLDVITNVMSPQEMAEKMPGFDDDMQKPMIWGVAIVQRGLYGILEAVITQASSNINAFKSLLEPGDFSVIEDLLQMLQIQSPDANLSDAMLELKDSFSGSIAKIDSYLEMNTGNLGHTFEDEFTNDNWKSYVTDVADSSDYELTHYAINPSQDKASALFEYNPKNSWLMSASAVLLHFGILTEQAEEIEIISSSDTVKTDFMPNHHDDGGGKFTVSLNPTINGSTQTIEVDSQLPIKKIVLKFSKIEKLASDIFEYANKRILAPVHPIFAERPSLALVEKVVACNLNVNTAESIGTAMHLLSGNSSGCCYTRVGSRNEWARFVGNGRDNQSGQCDRLAMEASGDGTKSDQEIIDLVKGRSMSMKQVELLNSVHQNSELPDTDQSDLRQAMAELSMFIVVMRAQTSSTGTLSVPRTLTVPSTDYKWDFSDESILNEVSPTGGVQIDNAPGGVKALRIDSASKTVKLPVNINSDKMPHCTIVLGVYVVNEENNRGWVLSTDNGGYDRGIVLHDDRFNGMGMPTGQNRSVWSNNTEGQPRIGEWMHIAAVYKHQDRGSFYVDGKAAPNKVYEYNPWGGNHEITVGTNPLDPNNHWVNCWVKEVKVFNRGLNADEVDQLFKQFQLDFQPPTPFPTPSRGVSYPILYTDDTAGSNIIYAKGSIIQPLLSLSDVVEVWEFPVTGSSRSRSIKSTSAAMELSRYLSSYSSSYSVFLCCSRGNDTIPPASIPANKKIEPRINRVFLDHESISRAISSQDGLLGYLERAFNWMLGIKNQKFRVGVESALEMCKREKYFWRNNVVAVGKYVKSRKDRRKWGKVKSLPNKRRPKTYEVEKVVEPHSASSSPMYLEKEDTVLMKRAEMAENKLILFEENIFCYNYASKWYFDNAERRRERLGWKSGNSNKEQNELNARHWSLVSFTFEDACNQYVIGLCTMFSSEPVDFPIPKSRSLNLKNTSGIVELDFPNCGQTQSSDVEETGLCPLTISLRNSF